MKICNRTHHALQLMVDIYKLTCKESASSPVNLKDAADRIGVSCTSIYQLGVLLRNASLLIGYRGRNGGYLLARPAEKIRVIEIIEAVVGPMNLANCSASIAGLPLPESNESHHLWSMVAEIVRGILSRLTLADVADPEWKAKAFSRIVDRALPRKAASGFEPS